MWYLSSRLPWYSVSTSSLLFQTLNSGKNRRCATHIYVTIATDDANEAVTMHSMCFLFHFSFFSHPMNSVSLRSTSTFFCWKQKQECVKSSQHLQQSKNNINTHHYRLFAMTKSFPFSQTRYFGNFRTGRTLVYVYVISVLNGPGCVSTWGNNLFYAYLPCSHSVHSLYSLCVHLLRFEYNDLCFMVQLCANCWHAHKQFAFSQRIRTHCLRLLNIITFLLFIVHPLIQVPNMLVGAPLGVDIMLVCNAEASPKAINYWQRENGKSLIKINFWLSLHLIFRLFHSFDFGWKSPLVRDTCSKHVIFETCTTRRDQLVISIISYRNNFVTVTI